MSEYDHSGNSGTQTVEDPQPTVRSPHFAPGPGDGAGYRGATPVSLGRAIGRHPFLVILPMILLLAAGIVAGSKKKPTYSATAMINVGKSDIITQATPGYVQAAQVLASSYSRVAMSQHVAVPVARTLGEPVAYVSNHLTAVPINGEPTFSITGTGKSAGSAIRLTNAAVNAVVKFSNVAQTQQGSPSQLLSRYQRAKATADRLHTKAGILQGQIQAGLGGSRAQVNRIQVAAQTADLQAQAYGSAYATLLQNGSAPVLDVFNPAMNATTNRTSNIEKYAVVGGVAGLVIGLALAAFVGGLQERRALRRAF